jgi:glycosyltransferase involved in cell wall biosynthesis
MLRDLPKTGVVVPCYNEATRLPGQQYVRFAARWPQVTFCFVDDGSVDGTSRVIRKTLDRMHGRHRVIALSPNRGKAEAVRAGIRRLCAETDCAFVGYWDADLSTPLEEIPRFLAAVELRPQVQLVCGSRIRRMGANIERHASRHYLGRAFATTASLVLRLPIYDTQCGAKLFATTLAKSVFAEPFMSRWLFDVEIIARTVAFLGRSLAPAAVFEVPLEAWQARPGSKVVPLAYMGAPWQLLRIYLRYRPALK